MVLRHPNAVPLLASRRVSAYVSASRIAGAGIASLERAGFDRRTAIKAARTVSRYVVGFTLAEAGRGGGRAAADGEVSAAVGELIDAVRREDPEELFAFGLDALLDGLEARLRRG